MYTWIWRHIPFKQWQLKMVVSLLVIGALSALLWFKVFPAVEPILPFDDGQIETGDGTPATGDNEVVSPGPSSIPSVQPSR